MRTSITLGVIVPAGIDLAREILLGIRAFCIAHPEVQLHLISAYGFTSNLDAGDTQIDAIVAFECDPDRIARLHTLCPRVVLTSNRVANPCPKVINHDVEIGRMGAKYLLSKGYPALAFLHMDGFQFSRERLQGFKEVADAAGVEVHVQSFETQRKFLNVLKAIRSLPRPLGIMACSDLHARWFIESQDFPSKRIPNRFAVLGVDNDSLEQALCPVPLSSIAVAGKRIGYAASEMAVQWAKGTAPPAEPLLVLPRGVITRHSTDLLAFSDPLVKKTLTLISEKTEQIRDVADVVKLLGIPRRTLEYRVNKSTGQSLGNLLTRARIRKASNLLTETDLSIKEIAYLVGLSEPRMLSLIFKRETGETPSEYRSRTR
jgi:LacI family transcriptional regulator